MIPPESKETKTDPKPDRVRLQWFRFATVMLTLLVSLGALEAVFRIFDIRGFHEPRTRDWGHAMVSREELNRDGYWVRFKPHSSFELNYDSNPTGYFNQHNGLVYHINVYGLRGDDFPLQKDPNTTRILVLGDSFVFGEGVRFEHTTCAQLERILNGSGPRRYEVINAGFPGWTTESEINYLQREGLEFDPDLILVGYVLNDISSGVDLFDNVLQTYQRRPLSFSYLISWVYSIIAEHTLTRRYIEEMVTKGRDDEHGLEVSLAALCRGKELADRCGARFVVFIYPFMYDLSDSYPFAELHARIADRCRADGMEVLDLLPYYRGYNARSLWAHPSSDPHPNQRGHQIAAEALAEFLTAE